MPMCASQYNRSMLYVYAILIYRFVRVCSFSLSVYASLFHTIAARVCSLARSAVSRAQYSELRAAQRTTLPLTVAV